VEQNIIEFNFNPFDHHQLAAGCEDGSVKVFRVPEGGLTKNQEEPELVLEGAHSKRILNVEYHPLSAGLLSTVGADNEIKLWDLAHSSPKLSLPNVHKGIITCIAWNYDGSLWLHHVKISSCVYLIQEEIVLLAKLLIIKAQRVLE